MRKLLAVSGVAMLMLAACTANSGSSSTPTPTTAVSSPSEDLMASPVGSPLAMSCSDAFASISASDLTAITSLADAQAKLDATIQACPSLDDWKSAAQTVLPTLDLSQASDFVKQRCQANPQLSSTQLCTTAGS